MEPAAIAVCTVIGGGVSSLVGEFFSEINGGTFIDGFSDGYMWGSIGGAVSGAIGGTGVGLVGGSLAQGAVNSGTYVGETLQNGGKVSTTRVVGSFGTGAVSYAVGTLAFGKLAEYIKGRPTGNVLNEAKTAGNPEVVGKETEILAKEVSNVGEGGKSSGFKYEHNPMENPKAAKDIIENSDAVYGYSPNPDSTRIGKYANKIDWTNADEVSIARQTRQAYHDANESMLSELYKKGYSPEEIAAKLVNERNTNRLNSYIKNGDIEGLEIVKKSNLQTYGNESGMTLQQSLEKYGSYEDIIKASTRSNPGMDACTGLYDLYHGGN